MARMAAGMKSVGLGTSATLQSVSTNQMALTSSSGAASLACFASAYWAVTVEQTNWPR